MLLKVNKITEHEDGSVDVDIEVDDEFVGWFKEREGLRRWSQKRFEKFVMEAIKNGTSAMASREPPV